MSGHIDLDDIARYPWREEGSLLRTRRDAEAVMRAADEVTAAGGGRVTGRTSNNEDRSET